MFLDKVDLKVRILCTIFFAVLVISCTSVRGLSIASVFTLGCLYLSHIPVGIILHRLFLVQIVLLLVVFTLPFTVNGVAVVEVFEVRVTNEGLTTAVMIFSKSTIITLSTLALLGHLDAGMFIRAAFGFRIPPHFVWLMVLMLHSINLLTHDLSRIRRTLIARSFKITFNPRTLWYTGMIIGTLMVRAFKRIDTLNRVLQCRGFNDTLYLQDHWSWHYSTWIFSIITVLFGIGILFFEWL